MYWRFPPYVSVAKKKLKNEKKLKQLRKKKQDIQPVVIDGRALAKTWWGKSWNSNLERYADYSNRIGRGRSYVRHGSVLDLKITKGRVESLVMGSGSRAYSIKIGISNLTRKSWAEIKKKTKDKIDSLQELLDGKFPKYLAEIFTARGEGLFPTPDEIKLSCSCPDWAVMCKHVAATLYGVGARLDIKPELFFTLRGVKIDDMVSFAVKKRKAELLDSASKRKKKSHIIKGDDSKLSKLFNIDLAGAETEDLKSETGKTKRMKKTVRKKTVKKKARKPIKKKTAKKKIVPKKTSEKKTIKKKAARRAVLKQTARNSALSAKR